MSAPRPAPVAVIDIGSNSIKLLVAARDPAAANRLVTVHQRTEETRIGTGITGNPPRLRDEAMTSALASIELLLADAAARGAGVIRIVATSAVRDADNRATFIERVCAATGHTLTVLTGAEEAQGIGRGIACDPALDGTPQFYLFDLGGGSLEMLEFCDGVVRQLASLQLGCVRVTERFVPNPARPLTAGEIEGVRSHVRHVIRESGFRFDLPPSAAAVITGGTATTFRAVTAAASGKAFADASPILPVAALSDLGLRLATLTLDRRCTIPGVPAARADVFPAALLTLVELAGFARLTQFRHSMFNLRFGIAADLLAADRAGS
jgi:exopolyphosphatase/guanosine-5'-triphosphate,3'-diphosphate pyrophosphatase